MGMSRSYPRQISSLQTPRTSRHSIISIVDDLLVFVGPSSLPRHSSLILALRVFCGRTLVDRWEGRGRRTTPGIMLRIRWPKSGSSELIFAWQ